MTKPARWGWMILAGVLSGVSSPAQTLNNQSLSGKYYFRHISLETDGRNPGNLTGARTLMGSITFDGNGGYSYTGQLLTGINAAVSQANSGKYSLDPGGFLLLDNPARGGSTINARFATEAVIGSSTESTDNTYDLFVAIPAPSGGAVFAGPYNCMSLDLRAGSYSLIRSTQFPINQSSPGTLQPFSVYGHAVVVSPAPLTQPVTGATYTMGADGVGTFNVGADDDARLLSGSRTLYLSASGNILLGGSMAGGGHGIMVGVKPLSGATNATWNGTYWGAGLRVDTSVSAYSGALAARGQGKLTWSKRFKAMLVAAFDYTGVNSYALGADGNGTVDFTQLSLGVAGKAFVGAAINSKDPGGYEIYFGVQVPALAGTGVFLNPLGVVNAASSAPAGNPISPGQFVTLYGTGLAKSNQTAAPPYPSSLNGVSVLINNKPAPLYFVSPGQLNVLVPFATTGPTATIVVQNSGVTSNTVTVPVAATSPGIYALDQSGSGGGAILHADYSPVNAAKPAIGGETVLIYLTGLGTVTPGLTDGTAGVVNTLYRTDAEVAVYVGGQQAKVEFKGLAPGYPGLYQLNVTLPQFLRASGNLPLAIQTLNAYHDQVDIPVLQ
ncbi:MAG: hypothetical protein NTW28_15645 [Candidatus Solibacter sp.]|nr:hypothetical protein [Candidatus Solibacter sp.]